MNQANQIRTKSVPSPLINGLGTDLVRVNAGPMMTKSQGVYGMALRYRTAGTFRFPGAGNNIYFPAVGIVKTVFNKKLFSGRKDRKSGE